ncbi:hypothetical protein BDW62DRAFT_220552 [Aspergillus aurantiobrunneus]
MGPPSPRTASASPSLRQVSVLAFHWENNDMGVANLEAELLGVFRDIYKFETESWVIPVGGDHGPAHNLGWKLVDWTSAHDQDRPLRLYVYSGHASSHGLGDTKWFFAPQALVEQAKGDMAYIFDCCSAGAAALGDGLETICAMRTDTLKSLNGKSESLGGIFTMIFQGALENKISTSPVHVLKLGRQSITLTPLGQDAVAYQRRKTLHKVLLSVHLKDNQSNLEAWNNWLATNLAPGILTAGLRIESVFRSSGIVILVTVPLEIWTMLDMEDEDISFVSHVVSHDVLPALDGNMRPQLLIRPPPGPQS